MMEKDLQNAKERLISEGHTCVLCRDDHVFTTNARGVKPLMQWLRSGLDLRGFSAADKVIGKATAFLYCLLGVRAVYAGVISESALAVFHAHGITALYETLVPNIINRTGTGICPFEQAVLTAESPSDAFCAIEQQMNVMGIALEPIDSTISM